MPRDLAILYGRKSVLKHGADPVSPERQHAGCVAFAEAQGWRWEWYLDAGAHTSGRTEARPAWQQVRARLDDPDVCALVVESLFRASRSTRDLVNLVDLLRRRNIRFISLRENIDTGSAMGYAIFTFMAAIGQLESDLASERMSSTITFRRAERGEHWGIPPYGTRRGPDGHLLPTDRPGDHDALLACFQLYASGRYGEDSLAAELNALGHRFRTRRGERRPWTRDDVRRILNLWRVYAGAVQAGRSKDGPPSRIWDNAHAPILPVDLCEAVGRRLEEQRKVYAKSGTQVHRIFELSGLVYCDACGLRLHGGHTHGGTPVYRHRVKQGCGELPAPAEIVEAEVVNLLADLTWTPARRDELRTTVLARRRASGESGQIAQLQARLKGCATRADNLLELRIEGEIDGDEYRRRKADITAERARLERDLSTLGAGDVADLERGLDALASMAGAVRELDPRSRHQVLARFFERLVVRDGHLAGYTALPWIAPVLAAAGVEPARIEPSPWTCPSCGRVGVEHRALGLCDRCYMREYRKRQRPDV
jgi:DNA invertase Pin-like site-specific DNA recombinase